MTSCPSSLWDTISDVRCKGADVNPVRCSIARLMGGILWIGVGLAALKIPSIFWNSLVFSVTGGALAVAVLLAAHHEAERREYWLGFAVLGWGHFLLAFWGNEVPFLLTDYALKWLQERVIGLQE